MLNSYQNGQEIPTYEPYSNEGIYLRSLERYYDIFSFRESLTRLDYSELTAFERQLLNLAQDPTNPNGGSAAARELYNLFQKNSVEPIISTNRNFEFDEIVYGAPKSALLKRSGGIAVITEDLNPADAVIDMDFIVGDLESLRNIDYVRGNNNVTTASGREKSKAGDYTINLTAREIKTCTYALNQLLRDLGYNNSAVSFRYGGDEFVVAVNGVYDKRIISVFESFLRTKITSRVTFTSAKPNPDKVEIEKRNVGFKIEKVSIPTNPELKKIALDYLERGLILPEEELIKVAENGHVTLNPEDQNVLKELKEIVENLNIDNLLEYYPELSREVELARIILDTNISSEGQDIFKDAFIKAIKQKYFDRLVNFRTYTVADLYEAKDKNLIYSLNSIDAKGIKEINTWVAYSVGDEVRLAIEMKKIRLISKLVGGYKNLSRHIMVVPRGGTSITAVLKSGKPELDQQITDILSSIDQINLIERGEVVPVIIGNYTEPNVDQMDIDIARVIEGSENNWYEKMAAVYKQQIRGNTGDIDLLGEKITLDYKKTMKFSELMKPFILIRNFLHGKRYEERMPKFRQNVASQSFRRAA